MEVKLIILLGCLLSVGVVFGHRNHGSHGSYGGWNQHGGGGHHGHHGHHRHHRGHGCPHVNFEVKVPEGLEVSAIQKNPNVTMFGIELYVNREPAEGSQCDVCQNTTTVTYGKFIIEDTQVVIKNGDVLSYIVLTGEGANVTRHRMKKMWVTDSIINKCNCEGSSNTPDIDLRFSGRSTPVPSSPATEDSTDPGFGFEEIAKAHQNELFSHEDTPFECDLDPVTNLCRPGTRVERLSEPSKDWQREAQILAAIIDQMKVGCGSSGSRTNQLLLKQAPFKTSSAADLKNFVQSSLAVSEELQELTNGIRRVSPGKGRRGESTVAFEMSSYVDKQKVLYHARLNNMAQVVDYDLPSGWLATVQVHGGHGGGGGFHGGGYHGGHGRRPWGHGHWGDRRDPGWRPDGHHGHHDHREPKPEESRPDPKSPDPSRPQVNFIVHEPQGLEVWIVQQPEITSFGIELYVNKDSRETGAYCDLCANTTEVTYGKLFIDNQDVLVKKGDTLSYYAWIGRGGQFTRSGLQTLVVTESIVTQCDCGTSNIEDIDIRINDGSDKRSGREAIFTRKAGQSPRVGFATTEATNPDKIRKEYREDMISECDIDPEQCQTSKAETKTDRAIQDPHREIVILEDIVEHMKGGSCSPKVTNQLVLLRQAPFAANGDGDLMNFVRSYVGISAELQSLGEGIVRVIPANPGVGQGVVFEMGSYADKQRVLYHVRDNELKHIVDYDLTENSY